MGRMSRLLLTALLARLEGLINPRPGKVGSIPTAPHLPQCVMDAESVRGFYDARVIARNPRYVTATNHALDNYPMMG